jgi:hypothetical protein
MILSYDFRQNSALCANANMYMPSIVVASRLKDDKREATIMLGMYFFALARKAEF